MRIAIALEDLNAGQSHRVTLTVSMLYWLRMARRANLVKQPEYPNIEALIELEADKPGEDIRLAAKIVPPIVFGVGLAAGVIGVIFSHLLKLLWIPVLTGAIAVVLLLMFNYMARRISPGKARVRKRTKQLAQRICGFSNIVGVEPALAPLVGIMVDEAARIYLKHCSEDKPVREEMFASSRERAERAIEEGMARMLELGTQPSIIAQDLELQRGWAQPLLQEMRDLDTALDQHMKSSLGEPTSATPDPLAQLRQARHELQNLDSALGELEQQQNH